MTVTTLEWILGVFSGLLALWAIIMTIGYDKKWNCGTCPTCTTLNKNTCSTYCTECKECTELNSNTCKPYCNYNKANCNDWLGTDCKYNASTCASEVASAILTDSRCQPKTCSASGQCEYNASTCAGVSAPPTDISCKTFIDNAVTETSCKSFIDTAKADAAPTAITCKTLIDTSKADATATANTAAAKTLLKATRYLIKQDKVPAAGLSKCLTVTNVDDATKTHNVEYKDCDTTGNTPGQLFYFDAPSGTLKNYWGTCLDDGGGIANDGDGQGRFYWANCDNTNWNQKFVYDASNKMIKNLNKSGKVIDCGDSGTDFKYWTPNYQTPNINQKWTIVPIV